VISVLRWRLWSQRDALRHIHTRTHARAHTHTYTHTWQVLPRPTNLGVTQPEEFQLASLRRHEQYQEAMRQKVEADQAKARAQAEFKVRALRE
jgi:hypothetical protein